MDLINNVTESYCSFEVSRLIKERGFDSNCHSHYSGTGTAKDVRYGIVQETGIGDFQKEFYNNSDLDETFSIARPTHALAIEWIRVNYGNFIEIQHDGTFNEFTFKVAKLNSKNIKTEPHYMHPSMKGFNSPQEATEAALLYVLKI